MHAFHRASNRFRPFAAFLVAGWLAALPGCAKRIGDGCTQSIECSLNADRRCDLAQPGGYCTIAECDRDSCPDQAMCIEFDSNVSRLTRRFCMQTCRQASDCRSGYTCTMPTVRAPQYCPPIDPNETASYPACNRLIDTRRTPDMPQGYCVELGSSPGSVTDAGGQDP